VAFQLIMSRRLVATEPAAEGEVAAAAPASGAAPAPSASVLMVPLPADEVFALSRLEPSFSGRLGPDGAAELTVPERLLQAAGPEGASACLLLLREPGAAGEGPPLLAVSEVVTVRR
jgi:hypothetical protein